jgi:hypothetical protein
MFRAFHSKGTLTARLLGALLLYAVVIRALIPSALMLERDADTGQLAIVLCSAQLGTNAIFDRASDTLREDIDLSGDKEHDSAHQQRDCPFALAAMPVMPSSDIPLPVAPVALLPAPLLPAAYVAVAAHALPPLPPRGPPAIV